IMKMIRQEIYYNIDEFKGILNDKKFRKYFNGIDDWDRQKLAPREFPKDFPDIDLLKNRSFTVSTDLSPKILQSSKLKDFTLDVFRTMVPYHEFLRRAIAG
ncbi:MAG: DUF2461 family protein, partial [Bacteroidota bacterium]|nr:DUF2461 family protein [Bacteroidota bacterium]